MATDPGRANLLASLRTALTTVPGLSAAYLFGSVARGTDGPDSDLDVGLLFRQKPAATLDTQPFALEGELSMRLGRRVQLVVMNGAPVDLIHRILRDGVLLFDRDPSHRIAFEVQSRNAYFDLLPILREYRRAPGAS